MPLAEWSRRPARCRTSFLRKDLPPRSRGWAAKSSLPTTVSIFTLSGVLLAHEATAQIGNRQDDWRSARALSALPDNVAFEAICPKCEDTLIIEAVAQLIIARIFGESAVVKPRTFQAPAEHSVEGDGVLAA